MEFPLCLKSMHPLSFHFTVTVIFSLHLPLSPILFLKASCTKGGWRGPISKRHHFGYPKTASCQNITLTIMGNSLSHLSFLSFPLSSPCLVPSSPLVSSPFGQYPLFSLLFSSLFPSSPSPQASREFLSVVVD